jgi:3-oxoacyl-[acyl-carrier protein] reductase
MFDLTGKVALLTGATGGLGLAIAKGLHGQGATVVLSGTRPEALGALRETLGERAFAVPCNLSNLDEVKTLVARAEEAAGALDILVNNAGITRDNLSLRMKDEDWDLVLAVNLTASFHLARAALRGMTRRRYGRVIGITSVVGVIGNAGQANYAASKAGMIGLSKSLAAEVATRDVTVNCVAPGFIESPMTDVLNDKQKAGILDTVPAGRLGTGAEIAAAVVYLASREAAYVTGQTLHVNGGMARI